MDERPTGPVERSEDIPAAADVEVPISGGLRGTRDMLPPTTPTSKRATPQLGHCAIGGRFPSYDNGLKETKNLHGPVGGFL
jgi:hypothetical protein